MRSRRCSSSSTRIRIPLGPTAARPRRSAAPPCPSPSSCGPGESRELRGIGAGIDSRLRELVETGQIAELVELERELAPDLVGLGRYLGLSARRVCRARAVAGLRTARELREAAAAGRLRSVPGIGPTTEARLLEVLAREDVARPREGLLLSRARELVGRIADALDGQAAGEVRRWRDSCSHLAVVCAADDPRAVLARFAELPQIVAVIEQSERRAVGVTLEGVPIELVAAAAAGVRNRTGARHRLPGLRRRPRAASRGRRFGDGRVRPARACRGVRPSCARQPFRGEPPALVELGAIRGDLHCHTTCSDGTRQRRGDGPRRGDARLRVPGDLRPHARRRRRPGPDARRRPPPGRRDRAPSTSSLRPFRVLRGIECDILPDGRLDLPDDVLAELDWVQASVHGGQRMPRREMTERVEAGTAQPTRPLPQPSRRAATSTAGPRTPSTSSGSTRSRSSEGVALEVNGLPLRLDLSGEHVRDALAAGVRIVCSTDAHSVRGLDNMRFSVATARRGWATAANVLNTQPLAVVLAPSRSSA